MKIYIEIYPDKRSKGHLIARDKGKNTTMKTAMHMKNGMKFKHHYLCETPPSERQARYFNVMCGVENNTG